MDPVSNPEHYNLPIPPIEYILKNNMSYCEGNVIKYISRWFKKGGKEDLRKAKMYIDYLIASEDS